MHCGAAVVAADNSSQPEVVGPGGRAGQDRTTRRLGRDDGRADSRSGPPRRDATLGPRSRGGLLLGGLGPRLAGRSRMPPIGPASWTAIGIAVVPFPGPQEHSFDAGAADFLTGSSRRPMLSSSCDRTASRNSRPCRSVRGGMRSVCSGRLDPVLGSPRLVYLVDTTDDLSTLVDDLENHPGTVIFANRRIDWAPRPDRGFRGGKSDAPDRPSGGGHILPLREALRRLVVARRGCDRHLVLCPDESARAMAESYGLSLKAS